MHCEITDNWDDVLSSFPSEKKDIYFTRKYVELYETAEKKAVCVICRDGDRIMLMPFLRDEIQGYYDFETAYGYGGPIANTDECDWCYKALHQIYDYLKEKNYLCGFLRLHPLLSNERIIDGKQDDSTNDNPFNVIYDRNTIAIDTSQSIEEIWTNQISSKNRNMIRKAEKNQLEYKSEYDYASYNEFVSLYRDTMKRLSADEFYFFSDSYFDSFREKFSESSFLGTVRKNGILICAAIFMYSDNYGHYHLEGSDRAYSSLGANNYLLWKAACEMHTLGIKEFHLGGGTSSLLDDPLYKFKKAFSNNEKKFYICKTIMHTVEYERICHEWELNNIEKSKLYGNRLLKYRY